MERTISVKYEFPLANLAKMVYVINNEIDEKMCEIYDISYSYNKKEGILLIEYTIPEEDMVEDILNGFFEKEPISRTTEIEEEYDFDFTFYDLDSLLDEVTPCHLDLSDFDIEDDM